MAGEFEAVATGVPESVQQLIEQQLKQLSTDDAAIIEAASVAGVAFTATAVAAALGQEVEGIETRCAALAQRGQFFHARSATDWPDGTVTTQYRFLHALYQEALYAWVPANRRVRWHRQIGARLEAGYGTHAQDIAAELADHFVRGRDVPRAIQYLRRAAENAVRRSAHQEALAHLHQGLALLPTLPETSERTLQTLDMYTALGSALAGTRLPLASCVRPSSDTASCAG